MPKFSLRDDLAVNFRLQNTFEYVLCRIIYNMVRKKGNLISTILIKQKVACATICYQVVVGIAEPLFATLLQLKLITI